MPLTFGIEAVAEINLEISRGDAEKWTVVLNDKDGAPVNISTATTITLTIRNEIDSAKIFDYTLTDEIALIDSGANGEFEIANDPAKLIAAGIGVFEYDIEYEDPSNGPLTVARGKFKIKGDITTP